MYLAKYGVAFKVRIPIVKRGVVDFSQSTDWTPAAADGQISKDGGAFANMTNTVAASQQMASARGAGTWEVSLTATEMQAAEIVVFIVDAATKVIEDQAIVIQTYGNASAAMPIDLSTTIPVQVFDETLTAATHDVANSAGRALRGNLNSDIGTAQAGAAGTITLRAGASAVDSFYLGQRVRILEGIGVGQERLITAYVGATKVATVANNWATNPDNTSVYTVLPARGFTPIGGFADGAITAAAIATDAIGSDELAATATSEIATAVLDAAIVEPSGPLTWPGSIREIVGFLGAMWRNKRTQTSTTESVRDDADAVTLWTKSKSDDGTTFTTGEAT